MTNDHNLFGKLRGIPLTSPVNNPRPNSLSFSLNLRPDYSSGTSAPAAGPPHPDGSPTGVAAGGDGHVPSLWDQHVHGLGVGDRPRAALCLPPDPDGPFSMGSGRKETGFSRVILTSKHHDGFCLWPGELTEYSVRSSPWRNGTGDVVAELAAAAKEAGIGMGLYLSPWDRHEECYGKTLEYNEFYMGQMRELLTRYGEIKEVWLDGAKGDGEKDMDYFFDSWFSLIRQLQPGAVIFSDAGPGTRWIGDEAGSAGHDWVPPECDVSIRPGWFWHMNEAPKSALALLDIYYKSVGRNCVLLLNVPPNSLGLISDEDIRVLREFQVLRNSIFSRNLAKMAFLNASSTRGGIQDSKFSTKNLLLEDIYTYWAPEENGTKWALDLQFPDSVSFHVLKIQEPIHMGQRISKFHVKILGGEGQWRRVINGTTVGYQRLIPFQRLKTRRVRFVVDKSRDDPLISYLGLYMDKFSNLSDFSHTSSSQVHTIRSHGIEQMRSNHSGSASVYSST
ncbi:hypothetical protein SAY86_017094 [Trapa natans]|uniref:alpha-L-fucosidase n=1 Tax=Trapa natans TaxID=22666 RepID=A0AAN7M5P2_TRANT|nr:hypothetical protein SAY86_017094 [Trapa natans]